MEDEAQVASRTLLRAAVLLSRRGTAGCIDPAVAVSAARAAAASGSTGAVADQPTAHATTESAKAAFAASLSGQKRSRWGGGSTELVAAAPDTGTGAGTDANAKRQQGLAISQLSETLAAFRKDRGVDAQPGQKFSLKLFVPEQVPGQRERNWVGIFIGRDGSNKKRLEEETGATIFLRGDGTMLRGQPNTQHKSHRGNTPRKGGGRGGRADGRGRGGGHAADDADAEAMHVLIEAQTEDALDRARIKVLEILNGPRRDSSALTVFDEASLTTAAIQKATGSEECAFCGKPGHHHSKCPKRTSTFKMAGVRCSTCGSTAHTARDCKGDRSQVASLVPPGYGTDAMPSIFDDDEFAAFDAELRRRQ